MGLIPGSRCRCFALFGLDRCAQALVRVGLVLDRGTGHRGRAVLPVCFLHELLGFGVLSGAARALGVRCCPCD
ncbi:hypothetical protein [Isoptericola sp. AK164]|uniref:hypothetical protein n=1 Tax=Isoptericola sp. AK164 TaxID=3024246 RepID=UPI00241860D2|nr:hypothetical protein [Isoptericola sp. AK164]